MIRSDGWNQYSIWEHSTNVRELYTRRCRQEAEEMTCHAQAVELLAPFISPGDTLLDVGCGSGYFFHSLRSRNISVEYWGMDASETLLRIGRDILPAFGLPQEHLIHMRLDDLTGDVDHVVCLNVLSNLDNYHRFLERILLTARKSVILRESLAPAAHYAWIRDNYLDTGCNLYVHVNTYAQDDVLDFIQKRGFSTRIITDRHAGGKPELVIDHPHHWTFVVARRQGDK